MRYLVAISLSWLAAACGDLDVKSVRSPQVVPTALLGEWSGTWTSANASAATTSGDVLVRVQAFEDQPIVQVQFDHPCVEPRVYELVLSGESIALRADGVVVLAASLAGEGQLLGTFQCPADLGTWSATRQRDLPVVLDLGGSWQAELAVIGAPVRAFDLSLVQSVRSGFVQLDGLLDLGDLWPLPVMVEGPVQFVGEEFQFALRTVVGSSPDVLLTAVGERLTLRVDVGMFQVVGASALPFNQGIFRMQRAAD